MKMNARELMTVVSQFKAEQQQREAEIQKLMAIDKKKTEEFFNSISKKLNREATIDSIFELHDKKEAERTAKNSGVQIPSIKVTAPTKKTVKKPTLEKGIFYSVEYLKEIDCFYRISNGVEIPNMADDDYVVFLDVINFENGKIANTTVESVIVSAERVAYLKAHYCNFYGFLDVKLQRTNTHIRNSIALYAMDDVTLDPANDDRSANHLFANRRNKRRIDPCSNNGLNYSMCNFYK
jgi:hypothetical protein